MALPRTSVTHYKATQQLKSKTARAVDREWARIRPDDLDLSWRDVGQRVARVITQAKMIAAIGAVEYAVAEGAEVGMPVELPGAVNIAAFTTASMAGVPVDMVTRGAVVQSKAGIASGLGAVDAVRQGGAWLRRLALNEVTASSSAALSTTIAASPRTTGFVRMLNPPSCRDCVILAGKWFRWNEGFDRHPNCDCVHVPAREAMNEVRTDPYAYFQSLSRDEQNKLFGPRDAESIRQGADIYRVVNVRNRGASTGHSWSARLYGSPTVTIDDLLIQSRGDRARMRELMLEHGFILPQGQVAGGALAGNAGGSPWGFSAGALGRGGTRRGATDAYRRAIETGQRDPLDPATQTAAERRFHRAYLNREAMLAGRNPFSSSRPLTTRQRELVEAEWQAQLAALDDPRTPGQIRALARLLGI